MKYAIKTKIIATMLLLVSGCWPVLQATAEVAGNGSKVDLLILDQLREEGRADLFVKMASEASLADAHYLADRTSRVQFVKDTLAAHAADSQAEVLALLAAEGVPAKSFWLNNSIFVSGASFGLVTALANRADVAYLRGNRKVSLIEPVETAPAADAGVDAIEWNISKINAPAVWATGNKGEGIVVANIDTGVRYTHNALKAQYRGTASESHDYNWWDPDLVLAVPTDNNGHGTHVMGTMVGDDGGSNQIGVAPGATWIAAQGCDSSSCSDFDLISSAEWIACPTRVDGTDPDCSKAPHVVNNSWSGGSGDTWYWSYVRSWLAAGIAPVFAAGNSGSNCNTIQSPGDYANTISVGATDINDVLASFSSKGPSTLAFGERRWQPYMAAPGANIRSAYRNSDTSYAILSGTSMAAPHIAGVIALQLNEAPFASVQRINLAQRLTAVQSLGAPPGPDACDGRNFDQFPNAIYGYGRVDAAAAVNGL